MPRCSTRPQATLPRAAERSAAGRGSGSAPPVVELGRRRELIAPGWWPPGRTRSRGFAEEDCKREVFLRRIVDRHNNARLVSHERRSFATMSSFAIRHTIGRVGLRRRRLSHSAAPPVALRAQKNPAAGDGNYRQGRPPATHEPRRMMASFLPLQRNGTRVAKRGHPTSGTPVPQRAHSTPAFSRRRRLKRDLCGSSGSNSIGQPLGIGLVFVDAPRGHRYCGSKG